MSATMSSPTIEKLGPKCYGFWPYDQFPYVLGSEGQVIHTKPAGRYRDKSFLAKGYGGAAFENAVLMPIEQGQMIQQKLDELKAAYDSTIKAVKKGFLTTAKQLAPFIRS